MALLSNDFHVTTPVSRALASVAGFFDRFGAAVRAANDYDQLVTMSDSQLQARGLERSDIARYVAAKHLDI